jgi:signal peptidase I
LTVVIALATCVIFGMKAWVVEGFEVPSQSMLPTLRPGDRVWVNKLAYRRGRLPARGDIVVFPHPDTGVLFVKRVVGLPGDRITTLGRQVLLDGAPVETFSTPLDTQEPALWGTAWPAAAQMAWATMPDTRAHYRVMLLPLTLASWRLSGSWVVPPQAVFVMGDNRDDSSDSRAWGSVPLDTIIGQVVCRVDAGRRADVPLPARTSCHPDASWAGEQ